MLTFSLLLYYKLQFTQQTFWVMLFHPQSMQLFWLQFLSFEIKSNKTINNSKNWFQFPNPLWFWCYADICFKLPNQIELGGIVLVFLARLSPSPSPHFRISSHYKNVYGVDCWQNLLVSNSECYSWICVFGCFFHFLSLVNL